jgi:tetratricopeptide (TPR) repeat protein
MLANKLQISDHFSGMRYLTASHDGVTTLFMYNNGILKQIASSKMHFYQTEEKYMSRGTSLTAFYINFFGDRFIVTSKDFTYSTKYGSYSTRYGLYNLEKQEETLSPILDIRDLKDLHILFVYKDHCYISFGRYFGNSNKEGLIDITEGKLVIPLFYNSVTPLRNSKFVIVKDNLSHYGLYDIVRQREAVPPHFEGLICSYDEKIGLFNLVNKKPFYAFMAEDGYFTPEYTTLEEAIADVDKHRAQPDFISAVQKRADADDDRAQCFLGKSLYQGMGLKKNAKQGIEYLTLASSHGNGEAAYYLSSIYSSMKQPDNALSWLKEAARLEYPEAEYVMGVRFENGVGEKRDVSVATQWFSNAYERGYEAALDSHVKTWNGAADIEMQVYNYKKAVEYYNQVLRKITDDAKIFNNRGYCLMKMGEDFKAKQDFDQALAINPQMSEAKSNVDIVNEHLRQADIAKAYDLQISRADSAFSKRDYETASSLLLSAIQYKKTAESYNRLGDCYYNCQLYREARSYYQNAQRLNPADKHAKSMLSSIKWTLISETLNAISGAMNNAVNTYNTFNPKAAGSSVSSRSVRTPTRASSSAGAPSNSSSSKASSSSSVSSVKHLGCPVCGSRINHEVKGSGTCQVCLGNGWTWETGNSKIKKLCYSCHGTGKCVHCHGTGYLR